MLRRHSVLGCAVALFEPEIQYRKADERVDWQSESLPSRTGFYRRIGKRVFDIGASILGLVLLAPVFALCTIMIKLDSLGPVFFRQNRVGKAERRFRILKFRAMVDGAEHAGPAITSFGDARVTRLGAVLRRLKIDELPQLWNVLKGDMSLVGPRPELPEYVKTYSPQQLRVLMVRPGITDIASIRYRDEEQVLHQSNDAERFYREIVLPHKLALNLEYTEKVSFFYDLYLICLTVWSLFVFVPVGKEKAEQGSPPIARRPNN